MLQINEKKINNLLDKNINLEKSFSKTEINSFLLDYLNSYIDFIKVKKILNYKTINKKEFNIFDCINKKYKSINFMKIGEGYFGEVYKINNNICVKIEKIGVYNLYNRIIAKNNELKILKICGNKKIGPKLYFNDIIYNEYNSYFYYYTYMEYIDGITLLKFLDIPQKNEIKKKIMN